MIIISKHTNQLCNRLFTYLPILSYAIEANEPVCFWFQSKAYNQFFPQLAKEGIASYFPESSIKGGWCSKTVNGVVRMLDKVVHLVLKTGEPLPLHKPLGVLFNPKWKEIRYDTAFIIKHADRLRLLFAPSDHVASEVQKLLGPKRPQVVTVGVHLRRGDYRTYLNGKYYYENEVYIRYMQQLKEEIEKEGKEARFLLCSNESTADERFRPFHIIRQQGGDMMIDLYGLAACDYIIGPPSTYSQWASFWGKVPLRPLDSSDLQLKLGDFKRVVMLDHFES